MQRQRHVDVDAEIESLRDRSDKRLASELETAQALAAKLETFQIVFAVKTGPGGKMFGSVTAQDLVSRIGEEGIKLEKKQVNLLPYHGIAAKKYEKLGQDYEPAGLAEPDQATLDRVAAVLEDLGLAVVVGG